MQTTLLTNAASHRATTALRLLAPVLLIVATGITFSASAMAMPTAFDTSGKTELLAVQASGVQIYECHADDAGHLTWKFREPLAILSAEGKIVGRHFAGPSWQVNDGSTVMGKVVAQKPGATDRDIALLQLDVTGHEGQGVMTRVSAVQRLDTQGGVFAGECSQSGAVHLEPYSARYVFFGK